MESSAVTQAIELIARGLEVLGVAVIGIAFLYATSVALYTSGSGNRTLISR